MSFSQKERNIIHSQTHINRGRKSFGKFDEAVTHDQFSTELITNNGVANLSIVVSVMDRPEKFEKTLSSLYKSIAFLDTFTAFSSIKVFNSNVLVNANNNNFSNNYLKS